MLASAVLQNIQSLIDLFWVGRLGPDAIASVAMGGTVMMLLFPLLMGLATGTVALVARSMGGGLHREAGRAAAQALFLAVLLGIATALSGLWVAGRLLRALGAAEQVVETGSGYLRILLLGSVAACVLFTANSALQGAGDTVTPMFAMLLANALNIVLDPILIFGPGPLPALGVRGAALATILAQSAAAVIPLRRLMLGRTEPRVRLRGWRPDWALCRRLLRIGIPGTGQMLSRSLMYAVLMNLVAGFGTVAVAAYGIGMRFHMILLMPAFALANAAATLVGQNLGAERPARAARAAWAAASMDMALMAVTSLAVLVWAPDLMRLFSRDPEVVATGARYLRLVSPVYVFSSLGIVLGRALQGAGDTLAPMIITIVCLWGLQVPMAVLLVRWRPHQIDGIWWAIIAAMVANGLAVAAWFQTGRWKHARV